MNKPYVVYAVSIVLSKLFGHDQLIGHHCQCESCLDRQESIDHAKKVAKEQYPDYSIVDVIVLEIEV